MPVNLNTFKNAVQNVHNDSFVRMSESRPGTIVNYGTNLLGRKLGWYRHGTVAQNQGVREQLYQALEKEGSKVQSETLRRIRGQLGIDAQGKSTVTTQMTAREVRQILSVIETDNANAKARSDFAHELSNNGYAHQSLKDLVSRRLGLDQPAEIIKPLTEEDKRAILEEVKQAGLAFYAKAKAELNLPDIETLRQWVSDEDMFNMLSSRLTKAATEGKIPQSGFKVVIGNLNEQRVFSMKEQIRGKVNQALAQLTAETGVDCSGMTEAILEPVVDKVRHQSNAATAVITDLSSLDSTIDENIAKVVQKRKVFIESIRTMEPKLDPVLENGMLELAKNDLNFRSSAVVAVLAKNISMVRDLYEFSRVEHPTMPEFLNNLDNWDVKFAQATAECRKLDEEFGGDDLQRVNDWLVFLGRHCYKAKYGSEPQMNEEMKHLLDRFISEVTFIQQNPDAGMKQQDRFCAYSPEFADDIKCARYIKLAEACAKAFGQNTDYEPVPAEGLSLDVGNLMGRRGDVARRYPNPYGKVIDQNLGSAFKDTFLSMFESYVNNSDNDSMTNYDEMFKSSSCDLGRSGIGLNLGGKVISYAGKIGMEGDGIADIKKYFEEDEKFGLSSARVLSGIFDQGMALNCTKALLETGEACGGTFGQISSYALNINVTRREEGNYLLNVSYDLVPALHAYKTGKPAYLDQNRSRVSFNFSLSLKIDAATSIASLKFTGDAKIHAELHKLEFNTEEFSKIISLEDLETGGKLGDAVMTSPELAGDAHLKELLAQKTDETESEELFEYVKSKAISGREMNALYALGLDKGYIELLMYGLNPQARLTKQLMVRLTGNDRAEREKAFNELKALCQKVADAGWREAPELDIKDMALATVGGLNMDSGTLNLSELMITRNFLKSSQDEELRTLIDALASGSTQRVAFAKARLTVAVEEARRAMGVDLLKTLDGKFLNDDIELLKTAPDQERIKRYLENIVMKNDDMDASIQALKSYVATVKILNA